VINGAHVVLYSRDAEGDRAFLRDVMGWTHVDAGAGWLIFALPPTEVAVHPRSGHEEGVSSTGGHTPAELYLMCQDLDAVRESLAQKGVACSPLIDAGWGAVSSLALPGGTTLGIYQPRHPTAI